MPAISKTPPLAIRLRVLTAIDYATGHTIRERIKAVSLQTFILMRNNAKELLHD